MKSGILLLILLFNNPPLYCLIGMLLLLQQCEQSTWCNHNLFKSKLGLSETICKYLNQKKNTIFIYSWKVDLTGIKYCG